jgi:tRNA(fMet)-specific endonuclease VapC
MAQLVDSSVFIALERRRESLAALAAVAPAEPLALASITASELLAGVHRADTEARRLHRQGFVETILAQVPVLPFDLAAARTHARIWADLAAIGQPIGAHDLLIAATALAYGHAVLTQNLREFQRVPGLTVREPIW